MIEASRVVAIVPENGIIPGRDVNNLVIGPLPACVHFLTQYLDARVRGLDVKSAHAFALQGAVKLGGTDGPGT